jgi:hypothetical protein
MVAQTINQFEFAVRDIEFELGEKFNALNAKRLITEYFNKKHPDHRMHKLCFDEQNCYGVRVVVAADKKTDEEMYRECLDKLLGI